MEKGAPLRSYMRFVHDLFRDPKLSRFATLEVPGFHEPAQEFQPLVGDGLYVSLEDIIKYRDFLGGAILGGTCGCRKQNGRLRTFAKVVWG